MAYLTSAPPQLANQAMAGLRKWIYSSTADAGTAVDANGYFTNGYALGMRQHDIVEVHYTATGTVTTHVVLTANSTGGIDLGDGTTIGSTANAD